MNFINRNTTAEAKVEEISGVAYIFNQEFFKVDVLYGLFTFFATFGCEVVRYADLYCSQSNHCRFLLDNAL